MVVLFVSYGISQGVNVKITKTFDGRSKILGDVYGRSVRTQDNFFIESLVGQVNPYRSVVFFVKNALLQAVVHHVFSEQVGIAFKIIFVKIDPQGFVGRVKTVVNPLVHFFP